MAGFVDILKLIVDADTKGAVNEFRKLENTAGSSLDGVEKQATTFSGKLKGSFGAIGTSLASSLGPAAIAGTIGAGIGIAIKSASDLNEQVSKTKAVFGTSAGEILAWSDTASTSIGQSKTAALEAASSFGNMFQQLGLSSSAAVEMSTSMTGLASDFASFFNTDPATALEAISAAFRGEFDSVQKFVPTITAAAVQQEVLKEGLANSTKEITAQDKAVATYNLLLKGAGSATGDFAKTSGSLANQQRILKAEVSDLAAKAGNELLPTLTKLANIGTIAIKFTMDVGGNFAEIDKKTGGILGDLVDSARKALPDVTGMIDTVSDSYNTFLDMTKSGSKEAGSAISSLGGTAASDFARISTGAANAEQAILGLNTATGAFGTAAQDFRRLTEAVGAIVSTADMVPASADAMANSISRSGSEMGDLAAKTQAANDALNEQTNIVLAATGSMLGVSAAQRDFNASLASTAELQATGKASADELSASYDNQTQAAIDTASATVTFAEKQATLHGKTLTASESNSIMIGTLQGLAGQMTGPSQAAVLGLISQLQTLGAQHPTPTTSVNDQASGPLADIKGKVDGLDAARATITVGVNTSAANAALDRLNQRIQLAAAATGTRSTPFARGTNSAPGGFALVGEQGPELIYLPKGSAVKTAAETRQIMDGPTPLTMASGSGSAGNVIQITVNGAVDPYNTARQIQTILAKGARGGFSTLAA